jgi:hypothetical protein
MIAITKRNTMLLLYRLLAIAIAMSPATACALATDIDPSPYAEDGEDQMVDTKAGLLARARGNELVPYAGGSSVVELAGPSAQLLTIDHGGEQFIWWHTTDKRTMDVEMRLRVLTCNNGVGVAIPSAPVVLWRSEIGHGKYTWSEPPVTYPAFPSVPTFLAGYWLPARGKVVRMSARDVKIAVSAPGTRIAPTVPLAQVVVSVSFAPVSGMHQPDLVRQQWMRPGSDLAAYPFPIEATDWRVRDETGQPFAPGAANAAILDMQAQSVGLVDLADLTDWTPIPLQAFSFAAFPFIPPNTPFYSEFR